MDGGRIIITLEDYRRKHNISKYKIIKNCDVGATQLNNYCKNNVSRIDLPVLARICDYLKCDICDILRYVPGDEKELTKEYDESEEEPEL